MKLSIKNLLLSNVHIKIFSLIFGYLAWSMIGHSHADDTWITIPVCFDGEIQGMHIAAPETVKIHLVGKRSDLKLLDTNSIALHIDTRDLREGEQHIELTQQRILIPESIQVVGWAPAHVSVMVKKELIQTTTAIL